MSTLRASADPLDRERRFDVRRLAGDLAGDALVTAAIVWGLVALGEPLVEVFRSPLFIVLSIVGVAHAIHKAFSRQRSRDGVGPRSR